MLAEGSADQKSINAKLLKRHYDQNLEIKSGEAATEHFLSTALALWNAWFSDPKLKDSWFFLLCMPVAVGRS